MILRGQDSKVLRSVSGEVLEQSDAIIDLRSTFGVTKNASNEVSQVKLYNNPSQVFRAPVGNEPIEQGNGLEFDGIDQKLIAGKTNGVDLQGDYFIECWIKKNEFAQPKTIYGVAVNDFSTLQYILQSWTNDAYRLSLYTNSGEVITATNPITDLDWHHVAFQRNGNLINSFLDGFTNSVIGTINDVPKIITGTQFHIAGIQQPYFFNGNIDDLRIYEKALYPVGGSGDLNKKIFTPSKRSSE